MSIDVRSAKPAPYQVDSYKEWAAGEGVPIYDDFAVDLCTLEVAPWPRFGAHGAIVNLKGRGDFNSIFLFEIDPGGKTTQHKNLYEEVIYVISGHGNTVVEGPDGVQHAFEWGPKSLFAIPLNLRAQHFNSSGSTPARLASTNTFCMTLNLYRDLDFIFDNKHVFKTRLGRAGFFKGEGDFIEMHPGRHMWETNFIPDLAGIELRPFDSRGANSTNLIFIMADGTLGAHSSEMPVGSYKKAHRHGAGRHVFAVTGEGYTLAWYGDDKDFLEIPWQHGIVYAPPDDMFHQHFNVSASPARYLAVGIGSRRYPFLETKRRSEREVDLSVKQGGRQIEFEDQDPRIHQIWLKAMAKAGLQSRMDFFASAP